MVVTLGDAIVVGPIVVLNPVAGDHWKKVAPIAFNVTDWPD